MKPRLDNIRYRTRRLAINTLFALYDTLVYRGLRRVPTRPPFVIIESSSVCNLRCIMCDYPSMKRKKMHMDMALYRGIIDNLAKLRVKRVALSRFGEPLLHPEIVDMVAYAKQKGMTRIGMTSNATRLTAELSERLIKAGLTELNISIDGATKETFEKIRVGAKFDEVVANVERFMAVRKSLQASKPAVRINAVLMEENKDEYGLILSKWRPIVDGVRVSLMTTYGDVQAHSTVGDFHEIARDGKVRPCPQLWSRLVILSSGEATVCCLDYEGTLSVGNVAEQSIEDLWRGAAIKRIRDIHFSKDFDKIPLCKSCMGISSTYLKLLMKTLIKYDGAAGGEIDT